jgi:hypothetical protein
MRLIRFLLLIRCPARGRSPPEIILACTVAYALVIVKTNLSFWVIFIPIEVQDAPVRKAP